MNDAKMKGHLKTLLLLLLWAFLTGCTAFSISENEAMNILQNSSDKRSTSGNSDETNSMQKVANPPAKTIRFDGHEIVLGQSESISMTPDQLSNELANQLKDQRLQSAAIQVLRHRESAERLISERWARDADDSVLQFAAKILDRRVTKADRSWTSLLAYAQQNPTPAEHYQELRNRFALDLQTQDPSDEAAEQLLQSSVKIAHPLARIDAYRLLGLRELVAGRHAWAESQFRQAIEIATNSGNPLIAAELWLTLSEAARRGGQPAIAASAWSNAIQLHVATMKVDQPLDVQFWLLAEKTRPETVDWSDDIKASLNSQFKELGCAGDVCCEAVLWTAVANAQMQRGQLQSALVNFKKAETLMDDGNAQWLRIAQAQCLAAMGQIPSASAILSGPAANPDPAISAAATAALGSIKLQSGAFQQGAQLLHKALTQSPSANWPNKARSMADLALAQLILGETEDGLRALHEAQNTLEKLGQREALVRSLENEIRLLQHENRGQECHEIGLKIARLERLR